MMLPLMCEFNFGSKDRMQLNHAAPSAVLASQSAQFHFLLGRSIATHESALNNSQAIDLQSDFG
jgi:hypothetical protein